MDATRFTATGPCAHSKPSSRASILAFADPPPPDETPQQKVARLREAARRAKLGQVSRFDKVVAKGRVVADTAHRFTAITLIAATGIAGLITVFSLGDMVVYNRRKRREFFAEQEKKKAEALALARAAVAQGIADDHQILLLNRERAAEESKLAEQQRAGIFKRTMHYLYGKPEDEKLNKQSSSVAGEENTWRDIAQESKLKTEEGGGLGILKAVDDSRRETSVVQAIQKVSQTTASSSGPLDRLAEEAASSAAKTSRSWTSWVTGR
ncbi:hypothetical protein AOQ84DRAFT_372576 [Glonium stellatum]|uniref:Uncharacterized protein n=1 Tax=Glonium stellatum TaxID=574774 RepID=A0A8E2F9D9_9PEZI|nr:hypothetical protein AOQ84DRAFT_372576 [Glonium stellatum]